MFILGLQMYKNGIIIVGINFLFFIFEYGDAYTNVTDLF